MNEETLFQQALSRTSEERAAFLEQACAGRPELLAAVEALLAAHEKSSNILDKPPVELGETVHSAEVEDDFSATGEYLADRDDASPAMAATAEFRGHLKPGVVISERYTLREKIGEGGMGEVWVAKQTEPVKRRVALKLIKTGMDSKAVLARFDQERQALALMDHPNIARVLDAGVTATGQPFFVMELVNGLPLDTFCDEAKLSLRERLELFVPICQAVQHAHQKGIVHRDLKPANVLVTMIDGRPVPKVIDFGVAKAFSRKLTDETMTQFGAVVGTLAYMSPEQAAFSGDDIDTRADIYSLGVLLYELLTGLRPIDKQRLEKSALTEMIRIIREEEPSKPSTRLSTDAALLSLAAVRQTDPKKLTAMLRGELDWVIMKCLEKQRDRRYDTANALLRDIQRYLADEFVEARPPSAGYRLKKVLKRNKGTAIAGGLILATLITGITGTTFGWIEAKRQEGLADDRLVEAVDARNSEAKRAESESKARHAEANAKAAERERAEELKHRLGVSNTVLSNLAFSNRDVKLAAERLDEVPEDQRGWAWRYLKRQTGGGLFTLTGHGGPVTCVAFSPDGTRLITGAGTTGRPGKGKVWDARTGKPLFDLDGLPIAPPIAGFATPVTFSPDGKWIATAGLPHSVRICDATSGALVRELKGHVTTVSCVAFSPDGKRIVSGSHALPQAPGPDGRIRGVQGPGDLKVWDATTGKPLFDLKGHAGAITSVAFSPDGTRIVTAGGDIFKQPEVKVWDAKAGGKALLELDEVTSGTSTVAFSPDGTRIITGLENGTATIIDAKTGAVLSRLKRGRRTAERSMMVHHGVRSAAYSPDGTRIVTAGGGQGYGEATVWDAKTGEVLFDLLGHTQLVVRAAFSPDGTRIVTGGMDGTVKMWDARTGSGRLELFGHTAGVRCAAFNTDGTLCVTAGGEFAKPGEVIVWNTRTGKPVIVLKGFEGRVNGVAFRKDSHRIVAGGVKSQSGGNRKSVGHAIVWNAHTGAVERELKGFKEGVKSVAFSPDGGTIITGAVQDSHSGGTEVKLWDARTGRVRRDLTDPHAPGGVFGQSLGASVSYSADGKRVLIAGVRDKKRPRGKGAKVCDPETGAVLVELKGNVGRVPSAAFSPDGQQIATGGEGIVKLWDARTGDFQFEMKGHTGLVYGVAFSPDGGRIVSAGADRTIKVWDPRTRTTLVELKGHTGVVKSVAFSPEGDRILTGGLGAEGQSGEAMLWDTRVNKELPNADEIAYRQRLMQPNLARFREGYRSARAENNDFAAAFYLNRLPKSERTALVRKTELDALGPLYERAKAEVNYGQPAKAIPLLEKIATIKEAHLGVDHPETFVAMNVLAYQYREQRRFDKAIAQFQKLMKAQEQKLGADDPQTLYTRANLGANYKNAGRLKQAIPLLEEVHRAAKKHPQLLWVEDHLVDAYIKAKEYDKAANLLLLRVREVRRKSPNDNSPRMGAFLAAVGLSLLRAEKWVEAEKVLRESLAIRNKSQPGHWTTFNAQATLGGALLGQKKYAEAEPLLLAGYAGMKERIAEIQAGAMPRLLEVLQRLVQLYEATNKPQLAATWTARLTQQKAMPASQAERKILIGKLHVEASSLSAKGRLDAAIAAFHQALELDPKNSRTLYGLSFLLGERKGDSNAAIKHLRKAIEIEPKRGALHHFLGRALQTAGDWDAAIASQRKAVSIHPSLNYAHLGIGFVLLEKGRYAEAIPELERGLKRLRPDDHNQKMVSGTIETCRRLEKLEARFDRLVSGTEKPATAREHLDIAMMCRHKRMHAAAARFGGLAYDADPKLGDELIFGSRYDLARSAALAGTGQGKDASALDDKQRARLRKQALTWLRADLAKHIKRLKEGPDADRIEAQASLSHWQLVGDFAGIRDKKALAKLPPDERAAFTKFWAEVAAVLAKLEQHGFGAYPTVAAENADLPQTGNK